MKKMQKRNQSEMSVNNQNEGESDLNECKPGQETMKGQSGGVKPNRRERVKSREREERQGGGRREKVVSLACGTE